MANVSHILQRPSLLIGIRQRKTHIKALSLTPCLSASSLEVLMVLLLILRAHRFLQSGAPLAATNATTLSIIGRELSEEAPGEGAREPFWEGLMGWPKLVVGLAGQGEKVPWSQGPSWTWSRSRASLSRPVVSEGSLVGKVGEPRVRGRGL